MRTSIYFFIFLFGFACTSEKPEKLGLDNIDIQNIIEYQDTKNVTELIKYFVNPDMQLRERACMAFASVKDSTALTSLYTMLEEDEEIAQAAAFAIGQIGSPSSIKPLKKVLERSMNEETRYQFFVAIGKCGEIEENYFLASNYNVGKDARASAWALFYLSRNKVINEVGIELALTILENEKGLNTRLGSAQAIGRSDLISSWQTILPMFKNETNDDVQMALALGLKGMEADSINSSFLEFVKTTSANCQINFLKSIGPIDSENISEYASDIILNEENINLQLTAADYLAYYPVDCSVFLSLTDVDSLNWRVRAKLLSPLVNIENDEYINYSVALYETSTNLYERGDLLLILSSLPKQKEWLEKQISINDSIVATYGMNAFAAIMEKESDEERINDLPFLVSNLSSNNDAVVAYSAMLLRDSVFENNIDITELKAKQTLLQMPKMLEANLEIQKTINFFEGVDEPLDNNEFNHPIVRDSIRYLNSIKGFLVSTNKGDVLMEVRAFEAPGTVMSIARLVDEGYYNGKLFHRVVPNFVIQTGCPNGDGWGSLDFTMRSEFTELMYNTGAVGMASAGQDTESCQWFITHSPTPHLNGRYTIFAYVTSGMDVVHNMEVGDRINKMSIVLK